MSRSTGKPGESISVQHLSMSALMFLYRRTSFCGALDHTTGLIYWIEKDIQNYSCNCCQRKRQ